MNNDGMKMVDFDEFCRDCKFYSYSEDEEPCCNCLEEPMNLYSRKPVKFKEVSQNAKREKSRRNSKTKR